MQILWEAKLFSLEYTVDLIMALLVMLLCVVGIKKFNRCHKRWAEVVCIVAVFLILHMFILNFCSRLKEWQYANNNLMSVEGEVVDFDIGQTGPESFSINGVAFCYPVADPTALIAYDITQREHGSVITGDGQYLRVTYYCMGGKNFIFRIEQ